MSAHPLPLPNARRRVLAEWLALAAIVFTCLVPVSAYGAHGLAVAWASCGCAAAAALLSYQRRRAASARARRAEAARAHAAARIEQALDGAGVGLWEWHVPSGRRSADARAGAMLGYARAERAALEPAGDAFARVHPDDRAPVRAALERHLHGAAPAFEAEFRMRHRGGHWVWVQSRGKVVERAADGSALRLAGTRCDISARKQAEAGAARAACHDELTHLPNRRLLAERLGHALAKCGRNGRHGALLAIDLDGFRAVNDAHGHEVGDRLLEMTAWRLRRLTRAADTVAHVGGDTFAVLLEDLDGAAADAAAQAELAAAQILDTLGLAYTLDGKALRCAPSIGLALFGPAHASVQQVLRRADLALHAAKAAGGGALRPFDPRMQAALDATTRLDADLRRALARREFMLYYQPVVDSAGRMTGAEALIRWRHPRHGLTGPGAFIAHAETSGLIVGIGAWVLDEACRQLARWAQAPATARFTLAVNVSAHQFRQADFVTRLLDTLARSGADPRRLKLELTESMLLADVDATVARMAALKQHGIGFALDDFGTGYASLGYLQRLPLDQLKIDQSFVRDLLHTRHAAGIVRAVVQLAAALDLHVVAEGVEDAAQWTRLRAMGCTSFQGYLFAAPLAPEALHALEALAGLPVGGACRPV